MVLSAKNVVQQVDFDVFIYTKMSKVISLKVAQTAVSIRVDVGIRTDA